MNQYIITEERITPQTQLNQQEDPHDDPRDENDILYLIGFIIFIIFLFGGEIFFLIWCTKHGYMDMLWEMIP